MDTVIQIRRETRWRSDSSRPERHIRIPERFHYSSSGITVDVHIRSTNAALYWLARMLEAGEGALNVARRMVRFASEDIGNADP